ncbi:MAG: adenylosuccinate lyase [Candidatus Hodarchaeales archaeon]
MTNHGILRYKTPITAIFDETNCLKLQLLVERTLAYANYQCGKIPKEAFEEIAKFTTLDYITLDRVKELERKTRHDIMAVVLAISEQCPKFGGYVHLGATSNDIKDTVLGLQLIQAKARILENIDRVIKNLLKLTEETKSLVCIGRTHGQHAIPMTFGFKFANFLNEFIIARSNLVNTRVNFGKMSGAVGTYASFGTDEVEKVLLSELGLESLPITTQVISRTIHSQIIYALCLVSTVAERFAKEVRNLQRTEINELNEYFSSGQVGSSTMPQKRNPFRAERICGISRFIRQNASSSLENIALEHERDLTNSSFERLVIPQTFTLLDFILIELADIITSIKLNPNKIKNNLSLLKGKQCAENLMIHLSDKFGRQKAHELISSLSESEDFVQAVRNSEISRFFSENEIADILNPDNYLGLSIQITERVIEQVKESLPLNILE